MCIVQNVSQKSNKQTRAHVEYEFSKIICLMYTPEPLAMHACVCAHERAHMFNKP